MFKRIIVILCTFAFVGTIVGCGNDFLSGPKLDNDPNRATEVPLDNLFVGVQVNSYGVMTGPLSFIPVMFLQQMSGVAQHWSSFELYELSANEFGAPWFDIYGGGGLVDMKTLKQKGTEQEKYTLVGITKLWEALVISTAADLWGDIPYSEAVTPGIDHPKYDKQSHVRDQVLQLIDSAIEDLNKGQAFFDGSFDFTFAGDTDKWIAAAHTLKARILLNWAEVDQSMYQQAMAEAQMGIQDESGNWQTRHSDVSGEENLWWQFETRRFGYVRSAFYFVNLLKQSNDPRLQVYLGVDQNGEYTGSHPGENNDSASWLNRDTFGDPGWDMDLVTWYENQFIIAECQYAAGQEAEALNTLNNVIQPGLEAKWGLAANSLPRYTGLTGVDLLEAIMMEKYKALFLNVQIWSDWKRTAFPILPETPGNRRIPRRMLYPQDEINTNPNAKALGFYTRTENDPGNPSYPGREVNP